MGLLEIKDQMEHQGKMELMVRLEEEDHLESEG